MKRLLICFALVSISLLVFSGCSSMIKTDHNNGDDNNGGAPMEFKSFCCEESGMSAEDRVYEGYRTENGVHLAYYIRSSMWDNEERDYVEFRQTVREFDGDEALYQALCALFGQYGVAQWADFRDDNSPDVLDGSSLRFCAVLADETEISLSGTNHFPPCYTDFTRAVSELITSGKIESTAFGDGAYEITLPESWVGVVTADYSEYGASFSVDKIGGGQLMFFIIDNGSYYTTEDYPGAVAVGRLVSGDDVRYITARDCEAIAGNTDKIAKEALVLAESYATDKQAIIESLRGINGYTLIPEDGSSE